jgi:ribosomal protein S18 acetylase RimI-like enzyme
MPRKTPLKIRIKKLLNKFIKIPGDYIQLRLPVDKITGDFESKLRAKVANNVLGVEIREATKDDIESILDIYDRSWHSTTMPFVEITKRKIISLLKNSNYSILIGQVNKKDCAFAINYVAGENQEIGVIGILAVVPELQHKGLGTIIGVSCWDYFKDIKSVSELRCRVYFDNKASYIFLRRLGFEEFKEDETYKYIYTF